MRVGEEDDIVLDLEARLVVAEAEITVLREKLYSETQRRIEAEHVWIKIRSLVSRLQKECE